MRVIENFFFTPIQPQIYYVTSPAVAVEGSSSKQRSPFASEDVLIGLSTFTSFKEY